jgi:hypothetical protein
MAQYGKSIDEETASELIGLAEDYIGYIDSLIPFSLPVGKELALTVREALKEQETQLSRMAMRSRLSGSEDKASEEANSLERGMQEALENSERRRKELLELYANGGMTYEALQVELANLDLENAKVKEIAEELISILKEEHPNLYESRGKRLGQFLQLAKELIGERESGKGQGQGSNKGQGQQGNQGQQKGSNQGQNKGQQGKGNNGQQRGKSKAR